MQNIVYNKDCIEGMKEYPDKYWDLAICDPPYKIASQQKRGVGSRIDASGKMNKWNNETPPPVYFAELFRVSKNQIIWGANNFEGLPRTEYFVIWNKLQTVENFASLEYAWVSMGVGKPAKMFTYSIHKHNSNKGEKIHPTMKPISLYDWLLKNYAKEGDKILDTHVGSGSSRIAAHKGKFDFTGFEIDADYWQAQEKRYKDFASQLTLF
jgi:site-specific DNA-methyltransferase (adenine-specific)